MASSSRASGGKTARSPESFESQRARNEAMEVLQSYEKLSWFSISRCESLQQTRLHFQNLIAGFTAKDEASLVHWQEAYIPHPVDPNDSAQESGRKASSSGKGKERVSSANAQVMSESSRIASPGTKDSERLGGGSPRPGSSAKKKRKSPGANGGGSGRR